MIPISSSTRSPLVSIVIESDKVKNNEPATLPSVAAPSTPQPKPAAVPQDLEKRLCRSYLSKFLQAYLEATGTRLPLDGLLEYPFERVLELFIFEVGMMLLKERQNLDFISQWIDVLSNKKWQQGDSLKALFSKETPCSKILVPMAKEKKCHAIPLIELVDAPSPPQPFLTFQHLLQLQHQILNIITPLMQGFKQELKEVGQTGLETFVEIARGKNLANRENWEVFYQETNKKFKTFFRHNKTLFEDVKKQYLPLLSLNEIKPTFYSMVKYFVEEGEGQQQRMLQATTACQTLFQRYVDELGSISVPPVRSEGAKQLLVEHSQIQYHCIIQSLEILRALCLQEPAPQTVNSAQFNNRFIRATFHLLQRYLELRIARSDTKKVFEDYQKEVGKEWKEVFQSLLPKLDKKLLELERELDKRKKDHYSKRVTPGVNEPIKNHAHQTLFMLCRSVHQDSLRWSLDAGKSMPLLDWVIKGKIENTPFPSVEEHEQVANGKFNQCYLLDPGLKIAHETLHTYCHRTLQSLQSYRALLLSSSFLFPFLKNCQSTLFKDAEKSSEEKALWIVAEAEARKAEIQEAQKVRTLEQSKKVTQVRETVVEQAQTPKKKEKTDNAPQPVFNKGLLFIRDFFVLVEAQAPADAARLTGLDRIDMMPLDASFHMPYMERILELMQKPTPHQALLMTELLHHLFLTQEQIDSSSFYAKNPHLELTHTNLVTFYWRYPHSSHLLHKETPHLLSFLLDLQQGKGFTLERLDLVTKAMIHLFDSSELKHPQMAGPLKNERERLLKMLKNAWFPHPETSPKLPFLKELEIIREKLKIQDLTTRGRHFQSAALDLDPHLKRLSQACQLAHDCPQTAYTALHTYNITVSLQYIYELIGVMHSYQRNDGIYTHDLRFYAEQGGWDKIVGPGNVKKICQLNMKKGSDYPYWAYLNKGGKVVEGLQWINDSFSLSLDPDFTHVSLRDTFWVKNPNHFLTSLVKEHISIIRELLTILSK